MNSFKYLISENSTKTVITFVMTVFTFHLSLGQITLTIYNENGTETLPQATIQISDLQVAHQEYLTSDNYGVINIPPLFTNQHTQFLLTVNYTGFKTYRGTIQGSTTLSIRLKENIYQLPECIITGQYDTTSIDESIQKVTIIDNKKIEAMGPISLNDVLTNELNIRIS
jgi:hypothetical protein